MLSQDHLVLMQPETVTAVADSVTLIDLVCLEVKEVTVLYTSTRGG